VPAWRTAARLALPLLPPRARWLLRRAGRAEDDAKTWIATCALRPEVMAEVDPVQHVPALRERRPLDPRELQLWILQSGAPQAEFRAATAAMTGVEERDATVDRRVVEAALRQPEWVRRHKGVDRAVVRRAMANRLPPEIAGRTRRGEQLPDWLDLMTATRAELTGELAALREHPASRDLIDVGRLEMLMNQWPDRVARVDPKVVRDYRLALFRALTVSRYLRWFERDAAATTTGWRSGGRAA
jgi:asparagine synthase (glutamine-hydrolysing)